MEIILEDYVSFESAKFLKKKGFDIRCLGWAERTEKGMGKAGKNANKIFHEIRYPLRDNEFHTFYPRPTQALVVKWLRIKHNIHIAVDVQESGKGKQYYYMDVMLWKAEAPLNYKLEFKTNISKKYSSYEEATEAAILYCLQNLIK